MWQTVLIISVALLLALTLNLAHQANMAGIEIKRDEMRMTAYKLETDRVTAQAELERARADLAANLAVFTDREGIVYDRNSF